MPLAQGHTVLPRAVQKINDQVNEAVANAVKAENKPEQVASAVVSEPVQAVKKIDPDDYGARYANYKKATDETIRDLRQSLATTQATLATSQSQNQELLAKLSASAAAPIAQESTANTDDAAFKTWLSKLPKNIIDEYTEDYLHDQYIIQTSASQGSTSNQPNKEVEDLKSTVNELSQRSNKTQRDLYLDAMDEEFPGDEWITMTSGEDWNRFIETTVSPVDHRKFGDVVVQEDKSNNANEVIWVLRQYQQYLSTLGRKKSVVDPLAGQVTPEGAGGGGGDPIAEINAQAETFTLSQVNKFFNDVATTDMYTPEQAKAIEKQITAANAAGKIIPG